MRTTNSLTTTESLLRRGGLFAVVLAIVWGFLGMHVVAGAHAAPLSSAVENGTPMATGTTDHAAQTSPHAGSGTHSPAQTAPLHAGAEHPSEHGLSCNCTATDCTAESSTHGDCVPAPGAPTPALPPPGTLTVFSAGAAFAAIQEHTAESRIPDPPSPEQLSISRT